MATQTPITGSQVRNDFLAIAHFDARIEAHQAIFDQANELASRVTLHCEYESYDEAARLAKQYERTVNVARELGRRNAQ